MNVYECNSHNTNNNNNNNRLQIHSRKYLDSILINFNNRCEYITIEVARSDEIEQSKMIPKTITVDRLACYGDREKLQT